MNRVFCLIWTLVSLSFFPSLAVAQSHPIPKFRSQTIDSKVLIGYGISIGDVNGDKKLDILLADKKQFVWYENPSWRRHVIAENLTQRDNVCIAARDIDGDGKVEVAVGGQWNPGDTENSGSVHYLIAPADRTQIWTPVKLHHEPVVHRMRWVRLNAGEFVLVVAPLHGRGNKGGEGQGAHLLAYHPPIDVHQPKDVHQPWKTTLLDHEMHVTHNFDVVQWDGEGAEEILYLGKEGAKVIAYEQRSFRRRWLKGIQGGGEIRLGFDKKGHRFITTIEPFHGSELAFYGIDTDGQVTERTVLADDFNQGHAIATADLIGDAGHQIVAGWRQPNAAGRFGVKLFFAHDEWQDVWIDDNEMACEDLRIADLNADGKPDIVASGRKTHNLKIYWNEGSD